MTIAEQIILTLLITLTILQCLQKWGFFNWYEARLGHVKWLPDAKCMLCFGFWLSIIVAAAYYFCPYKWLFIPFACAGLINFIQTFLTVLRGNDKT